MLTRSLASNAARHALEGPALSVTNDSSSRQSSPVLRIDTRTGAGSQSNPGRSRSPADCQPRHASSYALDVVPAHVVDRRAVAWDGIRVEIIQSVTHDKVELRFRAPWHLLLVYEEGVREQGETLLGDLPGSTLRTLRRKLTFVPAGQEYREWQQPRIRARVICFYFDPAKMPIPSNGRATALPLQPKLFFEDNALWDTAVKLSAAIDNDSEPGRYCVALGVVVAHELLRSYGDDCPRGRIARGGLAVWQQRMLAAFIEGHLGEPIPLGELAKVVHLSSYYFCRAFKQSFGVTPHRYCMKRRIERAKTLLADPAQSVTEIALAVGFSETSSFSAAFRQATGTAPTEYRRALERVSQP
jgi:AraC family transcriptional regulator